MSSKHYFQNQTRNRIEIARERFAAKPQRFKWDRPTAGKWINNKRRFLRMGCFYQAA
jgi:hypothetical protein